MGRGKGKGAHRVSVRDEGVPDCQSEPGNDAREGVNVRRAQS